MGWFDRLQKAASSAPEDASSTNATADPLGRLFEMHVGSSTAKNVALAALFAERGAPTRVDLEAGELHFGAGAPLRVQAIGLEEPARGAFTWAWGGDFVRSGPLRRAADRLKAAGHAIHVPELTKESVPLLRLPGEIAAVLAVGVVGAAGYHAMPHGEGQLWLAIDSSPGGPTSERPSAERIAQTMTETLRLLELFRFDVLAAFKAYVESLSLAVTKIPNGLECRVSPDQKVAALKKLPTPEMHEIVASPSIGYSFPITRAR